MSINIEKALQIEGWTSTEELTWLAEQASIHTRVLEIGSYLGRSTRAIADNTKGFVYAVDKWDTVDLDGVTTPVSFDKFQVNMAGLHNFYTLRMPSLRASKGLRFTKFDMIFIDADHTYESVKADVLAWLPFLMPDGLLCGHDYNTECNPGVTKAVDELVPDKQVIDTIWYARR